MYYICVKLRVTVELKRIELLCQFGTVYLLYNDVLRTDINSILIGKHTQDLIIKIIILYQT